MTDTQHPRGPRGWHIAPADLQAYADGSSSYVQTTSAEAHLLRCAECRAALAPQVDPAPVREVWARVRDEVELPAPGRLERLALGLGLSPRDALLVGAAPRARGAWTLALLSCVVFAVLAGSGDPRSSLTFLVLAPLIPVVAVALSYGQDADPLWETTLSTPYSPLRLLLLRSAGTILTAVPVVVVASVFLPGPLWFSTGWLVPGLACTAVTLALSTWIRVPTAAAATGLTWGALCVLESGTGLTRASHLLEPSLLPVYLLVVGAATLTFWVRSDRLSLLGRTP